MLSCAGDERPSAVRRRSAFKLLTELLLVGVYTDSSVLLHAVKSLAALDFHRDRDGAQSALTLIASFAKSCRQDVLGLPNNHIPAVALEERLQVCLQQAGFFTICKGASSS